MLKGNAAWGMKKRILGWDLDTRASTLSLRPHWLDRLYKLLLDHLAPPQKRVSVQFWHKLLGELRSVAPDLPGTRGLFSLLQESLKRSSGHCELHITRQVCDMADNFRVLLADTLHLRPTRLQELVPNWHGRHLVLIPAPTRFSRRPYGAMHSIAAATHRWGHATTPGCGITYRDWATGTVRVTRSITRV